MTSKEIRSVSLSPENHEWLSGTGRNASELVDALVTEYRKGTDPDATIMKYRLEQLNSEIESLENQIETKESERDRLKKQLAEAETASDAGVWDETFSILSTSYYKSTGVSITSDDSTVKQRALEHGMDVDEFKDEFMTRWEDRNAE